MNPNLPLQVWTRWLVALIALVAVAACASNPEVVDHSFGFDTLKDGQDAEVIDYRYGNSKLPVHAPEWAVKEGKTFTFNSVGGPMQRGDFLYVKWRIKSTSEVYEDNVDLRHRLPSDIKGHHIHFIIRGPQLYVYLVTPEKRLPDAAPNGPRMYSYRRTLTIYPDQPAP
jgi:hypothetical protein